MSKYPLIPGMEAFMEDTEVNVEVEIGAPEEVVEEQEETAEAAADIETTEEESEATDEQTEMILAQFAMLERQYNHVKQYGADRTFMRLFNSNGELERAFRLSLPSCESFDATGDRNSAESRAIVAGMEGALSTVWEFIKNLCRKIARFFGKLIDAVRLRFGNLHKAVGRLSEANKNRKDSDDLEKAEGKTASVTDLQKLWTNSLKGTVVPNNGIFDIKGAELQAYKKALEDAISKQTSDQKVDSKALDERLSKAKEELKKLKQSVAEGIKMDAVSIKDVDINDITKYIGLAGEILAEVDKNEAELKKAKTNAEVQEKLAANAAARQSPDKTGVRNKATKLAKMMNFNTMCATAYINACTKLASAALRAAATRLRYTKKVA